jgi:hypothetical protein
VVSGGTGGWPSDVSSPAPGPAGVGCGSAVI